MNKINDNRTDPFLFNLESFMYLFGRVAISHIRSKKYNPEPNMKLTNRRYVIEISFEMLIKNKHIATIAPTEEIRIPIWVFLSELFWPFSVFK